MTFGRSVRFGVLRGVLLVLVLVGGVQFAGSGRVRAAGEMCLVWFSGGSSSVSATSQVRCNYYGSDPNYWYRLKLWSPGYAGSRLSDVPATFDTADGVVFVFSSMSMVVDETIGSSRMTQGGSEAASPPTFWAFGKGSAVPTAADLAAASGSPVTTTTGVAVTTTLAVTTTTVPATSTTTTAPASTSTVAAATTTSTGPPAVTTTTGAAVTTTVAPAVTTTSPSVPTSTVGPATFPGVPIESPESSQALGVAVFSGFVLALMLWVVDLLRLR